MNSDFKLVDTLELIVSHLYDMNQVNQSYHQCKQQEQLW